MQVFNRQVSARGLTVFGFETILISGSILAAAQVHGSFGMAVGALWKIVLATTLCELCFYYNDLYDLTIVHSKSELLVHMLQAAGAAAIVLAVVSMLMPSLIIGQGLRLSAGGILLGVVAAIALTRVMASLLVGVTATDPVTFAAMAVLFTVVAALAAWIPARRAAALNPNVALRDQ